MYLHASITLGVTFIAHFIVSRHSRKFLDDLMDETESTLDDSLVPSIQRVLVTSVWAVGLLVLAQQLGVNISAAFAGIGVLAFATSSAIANSAKVVLADVVAGVSLALSAPFKIGEEITVAGEEGVVEKVTLTKTYLRCKDEKQSILPNSLVVSGKMRK